MTNSVTYYSYRLQLMNLYRILAISMKNYLKTETKQNNTKKRERQGEIVVLLTEKKMHLHTRRSVFSISKSLVVLILETCLKHN